MEASAISSTMEVQHSFEICSIQPLDLLDPQKAFNSELSVDLAGGDYHTKRFLASEEGHKYVKQLNPTLKSVKPYLDRMKEPSVLLLRGCEFLLLSGSFVFYKFKSITALEISGCPHLTTLPVSTISQMAHLQSLDLSYLQIDELPNDLFINAANSLRSLVLTGCTNLHVLLEPLHPLYKLQYLDLSHLPIETLPVGFISNQLRWLILRGCSKLHSLQIAGLNQLHFLHLGHCTSLTQDMKSIPDFVEVLDLSYTVFSWEHVPTSATHLFFRNAKLCNSMDGLVSTANIKVCDLSGSQDLKNVDMLCGCYGLEALDLSTTGIESIWFLSQLTSLRTLILRNCTKLKQLPTIEWLKTLEVLDLSGCEILGELPYGLSKQRRLKELNVCGCRGLKRLKEGLFDKISSLEKIDLSNTGFRNLPSFANLINRGVVINHSHDSMLESTGPTELSCPVNLGRDSIGSHNEFHLVSTFINNSVFEKFKYKFSELNHYISLLEEKIAKSAVDTKKAGTKRQFDTMRADLEYILGKLDLLESSKNCKRSEELLYQIMSYDFDNLDYHSSILKKLLQTVSRLKILVPPPPPPKQLSVKEPNKKLELPSIREKHCIEKKKEELANAYESLTPVQRNCLLYFACLLIRITPISDDRMIKGSILIYLWYAEGLFFDPLLDDNSNHQVQGMPSGRPHRDNTNQQVPTCNLNSLIREIGQQILRVLSAHRFVYKFERGKLWHMGEVEHGFVIAKAMEEHSFDFNKCGKLTPHFSVSRRACLLKSDIDHSSSSQVWLNYVKSSKQLKSFETVHTLLYIDEPIVDINTEWFSSMANLHVIHLVNLYTEQQINIVDLNFLKKLKRMKHLRLLNLESFAAIQKLHDSICELINLRILNLAYCSNLMELPDGIASLTHLIILDLTQCHLLPRLPKGLALLWKLEVLKGFPITYKVSGRQSNKACTLRELLKLESLRKLNIVVNKDSFPNTRDLKVLRNMKELCNLKITWYPPIYKEEELGDAVKKGALRQSGWTQFKCWGSHNQTEEAEDEMMLASSMGNLHKLVLCCFPFETAPNWLHPTELQNLDKLYIVGGSLRTLFQDFTDQTIWDVHTLKLKYLSNLHMDWSILRDNFPRVKSRTYEERGCPHIQNSYKKGNSKCRVS